MAVNSEKIGAKKIGAKKIGAKKIAKSGGLLHSFLTQLFDVVAKSLLTWIYKPKLEYRHPRDPSKSQGSKT